MFVHRSSRIALTIAVAFLATSQVDGPGRVLAESNALPGRSAASGDALTGIQIQNVDLAASTDVQIDLYENAGPPHSSKTLGQLGPGQAANLWLPGAGLPAGDYAARVSAEVAIAGLVRTDWPMTGGAAMYSSPVPGRDVILPFIVKDYYGQSSVVAVQNMDPSTDATATVTIVPIGAQGAPMSHDYTIPRGSSVVLDMRQADLDWWGDDAILGSLFVTSQTDIAVASFVDITTSEKAVYGFEGVPAETGAEVLYAPLFRATQYPRPGSPSSGRLDTGISVVNVEEEPTSVGIDYFGAGGSCAGQFLSGPEVTIPARSSHVFYQGDPASQGLPRDCYGSAVIRSKGGDIVAVVNDAMNLSQTSAAYNAQPVGGASERVALPLFRRAHRGLSSGVSVMNVGSQQAHITLTVVTSNGATVDCPSACARTVGPNQTAIFWFGSIESVSNSFLGSAIVDSTQPVIVIVNEVNQTGAIDMSTYLGAALGGPAGGPTELGLPLLLNGTVRP